MKNFSKKFQDYEDALIDLILAKMEIRLNNSDYGDYRERATLDKARAKLLKFVSGEAQAEAQQKFMQAVEDAFDADRTE